MKTSKEREEAFRKDLNELLGKHEAEIDIRSSFMGYVTAEVFMSYQWDDDGNLTAERTAFRL